MGDQERGDLWESILRDLVERGLKREAVELGIMDGLPGWASIFPALFPTSANPALPEKGPMPAGAFRKQERELFSKRPSSGIGSAPQDFP